MYNHDFQSCELDFLRYAINNAEEEISVCALDGTFLFINELMVRNHHLQQDSISKYTIFDLHFEEITQATWGDCVQSLRDNDNTLKMMLTIGVASQQCIYYDTKVTIAEVGGREVILIFGKDITTSVIQEKKIRNLNYTMDAILNNVPVYLFVKDSSNEFRYIYWNKAFEDFSKIPARKVIGNTDFEVFPNLADAEKFHNDDLIVLKKGSAIEFDEEYISSSGETRYCHTIKSLIHNDHALPWLLGVSWDITEAKNAEKELTVARLKAEESDRLKSAFLANMSHELRTPLNAIVGFSRLLCDESTDPDHKQYCDIIDDNTNMLIQLINDILDLSKIEAGTLEFVENNVELNEMFVDIYEMHRNRVASGVTLLYQEYPQLITIRCDRNRLLQVMTNFINNAIKFTQNGEIRFGFKCEGETIVFFVSDTGMGISKQNVETVFNRFTKLNNFIQGTGLGLSICNTIAAKMNGRLWVESEENIGSTFYFSMPYNRSTVATEARPSASAPQPVIRALGAAKKRVLVAEGVDSNFKLANSLLSDEYEIQRAIDGEELLSKNEEFKPDLILMELKLSKCDGLSVMHTIRQNSDIPIVVLTASVYETDRTAAFDVGCNDFITKPVSVETLHRVLRKYI